MANTKPKRKTAKPAKAKPQSRKCDELKLRVIPIDTKRKLFNIAAKKGVPFSQYMRYQLAQLPEPAAIETETTFLEIRGIPEHTLQKLERIAAARPAGGSIYDVIRDECNRIIRETPEYMMQERREE